MVEHSERKGDQLYNMAEHYEEEATKASSELHRIIGSSDPVVYRWKRL